MSHTAAEDSTSLWQRLGGGGEKEKKKSYNVLNKLVILLDHICSYTQLHIADWTYLGFYECQNLSTMN